MKPSDRFRYDSSRRLFLLSSTGALAALRAWGQEALDPAKGRTADPGCVLTGELEEGPYYLDLETLRRDITESKPGNPMRLRLTVVDSRTCRPLPNAAVDIWHCDASGVYSGFGSASMAANDGGPGRGPGRGPGFGPPPGPPPDGFFGRGPGGGPGGRGGPGPGRGRGATDKLTFLRGVQITDANGVAEFDTVYPGWYSGRTIHIHTKVHFGGSAADTKYAGGHVAHTGQLFLPEEITAAVAKLDPYVSHSAYRTRNEQDGIFRGARGSGAVLTLEPREKRSLAAGFVAAATIAVDPEAQPRPAGRGPGGPRR